VVRRGSPQPGWLFVAAITAVIVTVALAGVLFAWWVM
jgi:hypothetical protein